MQAHSIQQKLYKVGEFGYGRPVLVIKSGHQYFHEKNQRFQNLDPKIKIILFHLDLSIDENLINRSFTHTLNEFSFVDTVIVDFPSFAALVHNHSRIKLVHEGIKNLIIVNPVLPEKNFVKQILDKDYIGLIGEKFKLQKTTKDLLDTASKNAHLIHSEKIDIISLQDSKTSLKLGSMLQNSKLHIAKSQSDIMELIKKIINDGWRNY